jgi:hypothetical protein
MVNCWSGIQPYDHLHPSIFASSAVNGFYLNNANIKWPLRRTVQHFYTFCCLHARSWPWLGIIWCIRYTLKFVSKFEHYLQLFFSATSSWNKDDASCFQLNYLSVSEYVWCSWSAFMVLSWSYKPFMSAQNHPPQNSIGWQSRVGRAHCLLCVHFCHGVPGCTLTVWACECTICHLSLRWKFNNSATFFFLHWDLLHHPQEGSQVIRFQQDCSVL